MNCSQARAMLATYRELNTEETAIINEHLASCTACRTTQEQYNCVGNQLQALPTIEPAVEARTRLMQALAAEHMRFIQRAPASSTPPPTPIFLAPYLRELAHRAPNTEHLAAFSTADTGPLPALQPVKPQRVLRMNRFSVVAVAASILFVLMAGSFASLLLLSPTGVSTTTGKTSIIPASEVQSETNTVRMLYSHIASAIEVNNIIYYTTYDDSHSLWQMEQFDEQTQTSIPLLDKPSTQELILLGGSKDWLIWLQIDAPQQAEQQTTTTLSGREWSLHALQLGAPTIDTVDTTSSQDQQHEQDKDQPKDQQHEQDKDQQHEQGQTEATSIMPSATLIEGLKFDARTAPNWVNKPVQGICFVQNALLVALIDEKGDAHLASYPLDKTSTLSDHPTTPPTVLSTVSNGHILASPTASSDGNSIYWAEEWFDGKTLMSNIWLRQRIDAPTNTGRWAAHKQEQTYLFRDDGKSFRPQIVNDTLFILTTNPDSGNQAAAYKQPTPTPTATKTVPTPTLTGTKNPKATPTNTPMSTPTPIPTPKVDLTNLPGSAIKLDTGIIKPQIDELQSGQIITFTAMGVPTTLPRISYDTSASSLQAGTHFLLWLEAGQKVRMYDAETQQFVNVGAAVPPETAFMAVNGDTAVVILKSSANAQQDQNTITINTFKWPWTLKPTPAVRQ